jgi:hypothetical protein
MKKVELEDDFLGGQGSLTSEEEKALSEFLKKRKNIKKPSRLTTPVIKKRSKAKVYSQ